MDQKQKAKRIRLVILASVLVILVGAVVTGGILMSRFYQNVRPTVTVEAGRKTLPTVVDFEEEPWGYISMETDLSDVDLSKTGAYPVTLSFGPLTKESTLIVQDTTAPEGTVQDLTRAIGEELAPEDFITSMSDVTGISVFFSQAVNLSEEGTREVKVALEDEGGNRTVLTANLTLYDPEITPVIRGIQNKNIYVGESIAYRTGVTVEDELDPEAPLVIDNSKVNLDRPGVYTVVYSSTDKYGRTGESTALVTVRERPENYGDMVALQERTEELLSELISEDMTDIGKAFAIYVWVRKNIPWNNTRTPRDDVEEALAGMNGEPGDCYTHAITCKKLLDAVGIENILMERKPGPGQHYWLMVRINDNWYHMDPSPIYASEHICFLETDYEIQDFAFRVRPGYYNYDTSRYPSTPMVSPAKVVLRRGEFKLELNEVNVR